jgi:mRNA-degrading endonuclease toxin of MazEF toxin-antitoxin module
MALDASRLVDPGEIFWVDLPHRAGSEQSGRRPCVSISRKTLTGGNTLVMVPITTNIERANKHRVQIPQTEIIIDVGVTTPNVACVAICSQVFTVDKKYVETRIGKMTINAVLAVQLGLSFVFDLPSN